MRNFSLLNDRGFTLMEVIVAAGIMGVLALAVSEFMARTTKDAYRQRFIQARDQIAAHVAAIASDPRAIKFSTQRVGDSGLNVPGNLNLYNKCVSLRKCTDGTTADLMLFEPIKNAAPLPVSYTQTGPNVVYYKVNGTRCTALSPECVIRVSTKWVYHHEEPGPKCTAAPP